MLCATGTPQAAAQGESGAPPAASVGGQVAVQEELSLAAPAPTAVVMQRGRAMQPIVSKQYQQNMMTIVIATNSQPPVNACH